MQQVATLESVMRAVQKLEGEGQKVSSRAVQSITGGSLGTVLQLIKEVRTKAGAQVVARDIPQYVQDVVSRLINETHQGAVDELQKDISRAQAMEAEALEGLQLAEGEIARLREELTETIQQAETRQRSAEKEKAEALGRIKELEQTVEDLRRERQQLVESGEVARIQAAKADALVETATKAMRKAESQAEQLAAELQQLRDAHSAEIRDKGKLLAEAEKQAAVAAQRAADQTEALGVAEKRTGELAGEVQKLQQTIEELRRKVEGQTIEIREREKLLAEAEKRCVALETKDEASGDAARKAESRVKELSDELRELRQKQGPPRPAAVGAAHNNK